MTTPLNPTGPDGTAPDRAPLGAAARDATDPGTIAPGTTAPGTIAVGHTPGGHSITLRPATSTDISWLVELRAEVMRPDLERVGVFSPERVRERFRQGYHPEHTLIITVDGTDAGCIAVRPDGDERWVEHFYLPRALQGSGVGGAVLAHVIRTHGWRTLRLNVLRGSRAEHLYSRCGFVPNNDEGVDVYLRRDPDGTPPVRTSTIHRDGLVQLEHEFTLPLDHSAPNAEQITVFARELFRPELDTAHREQHGSPLPTLVWFQGGPGFGADRPTAQPSGWINTALARFRVLLLDQRGTGRSSIVDARTLPQGTAQQQATFLSLFRADSIVRDAEAIRSILIGDRPWSVLGQSFGGFCILSYLSMAPEGLSAAMITGGVADIQSDPLSIYRRTFEQTRVRNADYFERYPEDRDRVTRIVQLLRRGEHRLPTGETLTPERFLQLGILLGSANGFDRLHYLVERALTGYAAADDLSAAFLADVGAELSFAANPLYAALHEAIYAPTAPAWAAQRARDERPEFSPDAEVPLFTGEMIFPWHFEQDPSLHVFAAATEILEHRTDWPPLYDLERLATNTVPVAAVSYSQDMYVPIDGSLRTGHAVAGMQIIVDDVHHHDGVRQDGPGLLDRLLEATTPAPTPTKRSTTPQ